MTYLSRATKVALLLALMTIATGFLSAQPQCYVHSLRGGYAGSYTSGVIGTPTGGVGVGVQTFDGAGRGSSIETVSINGTIVRGARATIRYTVNLDCTGTITWTYPDFGNLVVKADFVLTDNLKMLYTIGTDAGSISTGVFTKQ